MTTLIQRTMVDRLTVKMPMTKRLTCLSVLTLSAELIIILTTARATGLEKAHFNHLIMLWWSWSSCGGISIVFAVAICMHSTELMNESVIMYGWADVTQNAGHFEATRLSKQSRFQQRKQKQENSMNLHYATLLSVPYYTVQLGNGLVLSYYIGSGHYRQCEPGMESSRGQKTEIDCPTVVTQLRLTCQSLPMTQQMHRQEQKADP